jgi:hypothetical protein
MNRRNFLQYSASLLAIPSLYGKARELTCDVAVIGGGVGGFAAALAALRNGQRVVLTEETRWIGGQLTAQAVPPDEHPWIEQFGCTRSYRAYRESVREYYRRNYPLTEQARARTDLNPGNGSVSRLTHEFRVSVAVLEAALAPYVSNGQLLVLLDHLPESATTDRDWVRSVAVRDTRSRLSRTISAKYFLDATELGDLLPLTKTEFVTGAESQAETGELHAAATAQPANSQSFTYCFAMDYLEGEDHTIEPPHDYAFWRDYVPNLAPPWPGRLLSWITCHPVTLLPNENRFIPNPEPAFSQRNLWVYRRIADRTNFLPGTYLSDITLVNWPQNDYWGGDLVTASPEQRDELLRRAKQLSLSFLYWMQTEAPRPNGGYGWKGLRLRKDVVGTEDGLAVFPYIREARRIRAEFTVREQHVGTEMRTKQAAKSEVKAESGTVWYTAEKFQDSVGVGAYRIDLHPSAGGTNYIDISSLPYQVPLGALIPQRVENLLPAAKNIGTTHITNGCYRLHPTEWNIGEAAGALAAHAVKLGQPPRAIRHRQKLLEDFQRSLVTQGFELDWPHLRPL